jgi:hypothetical protein
MRYTVVHLDPSTLAIGPMYAPSLEQAGETKRVKPLCIPVIIAAVKLRLNE